MNYWQEKPDFWDNRTRDHKAYEDQKAELVADVNKLIDISVIRNVIDVGGYKGGLRDSFPKAKYQNLDIVEGFDITKDWEKQGLQVKPNTLCFTSLSLICFKPEDVRHIFQQMKKYSRVMYLYEEYRPEEKHEQQISKEYGGKWAYDWNQLAAELELAYSAKRSELNTAWIKATIIK